MFTIPHDGLADVAPWFLPERPGPLIFAHARRFGLGRVVVDRWPAPRLLLAEAGGGNYALRGAPEHRRQGLCRSCAAAVIADIRARGHTPT